MLGKLIKQEFRATGRLMAPLFGALLLLAVFVRMSDLVLRRADAPVFCSAFGAAVLFAPDAVRSAYASLWPLRGCFICKIVWVS